MSFQGITSVNALRSQLEMGLPAETAYDVAQCLGNAGICCADLFNPEGCVPW